MSPEQVRNEGVDSSHESGEVLPFSRAETPDASQAQELKPESRDEFITRCCGVEVEYN